VAVLQPHSDMRIIIRAVLNMETMQWVEVESFSYEGPLDLCDRSLQKQAGQAATTASTTGGNYGNAAAGIGASIVPTLETQATNPTGYSSTDINDMLVSGAQAAGGVNSGITGQANQTAARTRNAGGFATALDEASRQKNRQLSGNALDVMNQNAKLKQAKQEEALNQLQGLYGTDVTAQMRAMGLVPEDINSGVNAGNSGWLQNTIGVINALGGAARGAGSLGLKA